MRGKTVAGRNIESTEILTPAKSSPSSSIDAVKELLVPTESAEELRSELIFYFKIICERVRVANPRHLEARFVKLRPHLQMMPGKTGILSQNTFTKIAKVATARQCWFGFAPEICAVAYRHTKIPHLIWSEAKPRIEVRVIKISFGHTPRFRPGRERRILHFGGVIE